MSTEQLKPWALITGGSSGIGAIYADRLARNGYNLILVARNSEKLSEIADNLRRNYGSAVEIIAADLTNQSDITSLEERLRNDQNISLLVNNAGVGATTPLVDSDLEKMIDLVNLNVTAPMRLAYAAAPAFARRKHGAIINIGSIVAIAPEILNGVYGGSKAFILAFSRSLRHEFSESGVRIQVVLPGATATDFWQIAGTPVDHLPTEIVMPAEEMVDAALEGFANGEFVTIPSLPEISDWEAFENAREVLLPNLSLSVAAERYKLREPVPV